MVWKMIDRLLKIPSGNRSDSSIIVWWELRRIPYNLFLLILGIVSLMVMEYFSGLKTGPPRMELEEGLPIMLFALGANVGYTLGWIVELTADGIDHTNFGPRMFIRGTIFSMVLCTLPAVAAILMWVWEVVQR